MKITYKKAGDYLIPDLSVGDTEKYQIGKYGSLRRKFLKEHHRATYSAMLMNGTLLKHLAEIDELCHEQLDELVQKMKVNEGVTEQLKATDQMEWVRKVNSIRSRAEEIIYTEVVYGGFENEA
ncbi:MAG: TnpV protein [Clostridia bacterium]|nr:TnpV protein [Clostridia bacterium]